MEHPSNELAALVHELRQDRELREREFQWKKEHCGLVTKFDLAAMEARLMKAISPEISESSAAALVDLLVAADKLTRRLERTAKALAALDAKQ